MCAMNQKLYETIEHRHQSHKVFPHIPEHIVIKIFFIGFKSQQR